MQDAPASSPLSFDRADTTESLATFTCGACGSAPESTYFLKGSTVVCPACVATVAPPVPPGTRASRFFRALGFGALGGAAGAAVYGGLLAATDTEFGLVSILVGYLVGRGVHRGSYGVGGRGYQVLAVALTYIAIAFSYVPMVMHGFTEGHPVAGLQRVLLMILAFVFALFVPLLSLTQGVSAILGVIILGVGLHQAWRLNRREEVSLLGPFDVPRRDVEPSTSEAAASEVPMLAEPSHDDLPSPDEGATHELPPDGASTHDAVPEASMPAADASEP